MYSTVFISVITVWMLGKLIAESLHISSGYPMPQLKAQINSTNTSGVDSYLFGQVVKSQATSVVKPMAISQEVVATKLNLKLLGIIDLGDRGVAIVQNGGKTQVVAVNEEFMSKVILLDVFAEGILIDNRGKRERLLLEQDANHLVSKVKEKEAVPVALVGRLNEAEQEQLNSIGDTLRKSPMSISKYIKFQPLNENGQWVGVKIWANSDPKLYKSLGFEEGDILREVNGNSIQDMVKDPKLWQTFLNLDQFDLVVDRNGSPQMINVNFR
nr:type II secretion system protein N [Thiosulfativibrio zosterae]